MNGDEVVLFEILNLGSTTHGRFFDSEYNELVATDGVTSRDFEIDYILGVGPRESNYSIWAAG